MRREPLKTNSGGILLYAIITAMIISFVSIALVSVAFMRAKIMIQEAKRIETLNLLKAGYMYANHLISTNRVSYVPYNVNWNGTKINIDKDNENIAIYKIVVGTEP